MASLVYNRGLTDMCKDVVDFLNDTIKVMLIGTATTYTENQDHDFVDAGGANDPVDAELNGVSGYTRGFGGAGRKTLASKTISENDTSNRVEYDAADLTWTALGAGDTIDKALVIKEVTNDAASILIACLELTNTPTNGGDITVQFASNGIINIGT